MTACSEDKPTGGADYSDNSFFHYSYDAVGNRLSETTRTGTTTYTYDDANRLTSVNGVTYMWDNNGNLLSDGVNTYTYDTANRLKSVVAGADTYTYTYNGLNNRVATTANAVLERYVLDQAAGLVQVLQDSDYAYLYGNARIAQKSTTEAGYYLTDALGSVRQMVDEDGEVVLSRSYEPYGEVLSSVGEGDSVFAFTGEQLDPTGLEFLRARYYMPQNGRFIIEDSWEGDGTAPMSYNAWLYGYANPITYIDPTGLIST